VVAGEAVVADADGQGVVAYRAMACSANGSVPFYDLCLYGFSNDLRGYTTGEFQNRRTFSIGVGEAF
jgi:outer membrane protein assembly factor BamA